MRKVLMVLARGLADRPDRSGGAPLRKARTPGLDRLAQAGFAGAWAPTADGAHPSLDGFLNRFFGVAGASSSAFMLATAAGSPPERDEAVFRLSFVCLKPGATSVVMLDPRGFGVTDEENLELLAYLERHMPPGEGESFRFVSLGGNEALFFYRGAPLPPDALGGFSPPHAITGRPIGDYMPLSSGARRFVHFVNDSQMVLSTHAGLREKAQTRMFAANSAWLWGGGTACEVGRIEEATGGRAPAFVTDSKLAGGFAKLGGADVYEPGEKAAAACAALAEHDFVLLVREVDEVSPWREAEDKIEHIERLDEDLVSPLLEGLDAPCRVLVAADAGFCVESQEWLAGGAPFAMADFDGERLAPPKPPRGLAGLWEKVRGRRESAAASFAEAAPEGARLHALNAVRRRLFAG